LGDHHRRGAGRGGGGQQRIESADPGVAEPGTLLGIAVDLDDGVVDVDQNTLGVDARLLQKRRLVREPGQEPRCHRVELADVTEGEGP
jgi:hypothetical protein